MIRNNSQDPEGKQNLEPATSTMYTHSIQDVNYDYQYKISRKTELRINE
jgi:hypothetical protein